MSSGIFCRSKAYELPTGHYLDAYNALVAFSTLI